MGLIGDSIAKKYGGETIEMVAKRQNLNMPNDFSQPAVEIWNQASKVWAENSSGVIRVVLGTDLRAGNTWIAYELPALLKNKNVTKIISIDPKTLKETLIYSK